MTRTVIFSDLDRTLIFSRAALLLPGPDELAPNLVTVEFHDGGPQSYLTLAALELLQRIPIGALVPVTTRTVKQYLRVRLPGVATPYAVTTNGGNIVIDGQPDPQWRQTIAERLRAVAPNEEIFARASRYTGAHWVRSVRSADGMFTYLVAHERFPADVVGSLRAFAAERGWRVSIQGRKLYLMPNPLTKAAAAQHLRQLLGADRVLAAGDGALDSDLLEFADEALRPAHGELHELDFQLPHLRVTEHCGVLAGEEIVRWYSPMIADRRVETPPPSA